MKGLVGSIKWIRQYYDALMDLLYPLDISCHFCKGSLEKSRRDQPVNNLAMSYKPMNNRLEKGPPLEGGHDHTELHYSDYLCTDCLGDLPLITDPQCSCCSIPMYDRDRGLGVEDVSRENPASTEWICEDCVGAGKGRLRNLSFVTYDREIRKQIYRYKYKDQTYLARIFALMMKERVLESPKEGARDIPPDEYLLLSIPLHKKRQRERGYNQAHLLAKYLSEATGIPYEPRGLVRARETKKMHTLSRKERKENLENAFSFDETIGSTGISLGERISGKHILVVDDIYTTGTTAESLGRLLKEKDPASITVVTIARVVL